MSISRRLAFLGGVIVLLFLAGCGPSTSPENGSCTKDHDRTTPGAETGSSDVVLDGSRLHVSGPYPHENLTVFLVHTEHEDNRDFLTLDEGLKKDLVKVTELEQEQVGELRFDNQSDRPLYLQEGERLYGGKQDRTIAVSLVIPPKSGKMSVPTFCIEQSRWREGDKGRTFGFTVNPALAPKGVRGAAKVEGNQSSVWKCVGAQKKGAVTKSLASNTNSSANELLDAPRVQKISDEYAQVLGKVLDKHRDAVGVVIVVNGQIEEADVYPNHALLGKLYPRLVRSYAFQAVLLGELGRSEKRLSTADIATFLKEGTVKSRSDRKVGSHNVIQVGELDDHKFRCATRYDGQVVHWQMLKKNGSVREVAANDLLGNDW
jgi:hypothetical protein